MFFYFQLIFLNKLYKCSNCVSMKPFYQFFHCTSNYSNLRHKWVKKRCEMVMETAFLPPRNIQEIVIILFAQQHPENGTILTLIRKFKRYFQRQWMQRVTAEGFTVFYQRRATNNEVESFYGKLKVTLSNKTRNVWHFLAKLN